VGKGLCSKLKELIPRQMFRVPIQVIYLRVTVWRRSMRGARARARATHCPALCSHSCVRRVARPRSACWPQPCGHPFTPPAPCSHCCSRCCAHSSRRTHPSACRRPASAPRSSRARRLRPTARTCSQSATGATSAARRSCCRSRRVACVCVCVCVFGCVRVCVGLWCGPVRMPTHVAPRQPAPPNLARVSVSVSANATPRTGWCACACRLCVLTRP
jgi:hypothetical protein